MEEYRINHVCFTSSPTARVKGVWQWNYGQILRIDGLNLPEAVEVHFSLDETGGEAKRRIGVTKEGVTDVRIPDFIVEADRSTNYTAYAFIYVSEREYGNTVKKIVLEITSRPRPEAYVRGGNDTFAEILKTVNEIAEDKVDIPVPAKVGQVLAVKETDESGKPTEFEAKDMSGGVSDEKIAEAVGTYMEAHPIEETDPTVPDWAKQPEKPRYTASDVGALPAGTKIPSKTSDLQNDSKFTTLELDETLTDNTKAAPAGMVGELKSDLSQLSEEINNLPSVGGMTQAQITALDGMFKKCAFTGDVTAEYMAFKQAFGIESGGEVEPDNPEVTLTSISATYTGGSVAVGTALTSLTGITVTATYSDGSTASVTGYTLSGTIAERSNTITVSYGGKTTTFTVVGYVEQEEPTTNSLLTDLQTYAVNENLAPMVVIEKNNDNYDFSLNPEYTGTVMFQNSRVIGSANLANGKTYKLSISNIVSQAVHLYAYDDLEYKNNVISTTQALAGNLIATLARETTEVTFTVESDYKYLRLALTPPVTLENLILEEV